jgi:HEAT repeat protein
MTIPADPVLVELLESATAEALAGSSRGSELFWSTVSQAASSVPVDEVLAVAITFCGSDSSAMRATGAALVAELCNPGRELVDEALGILGPLLAREVEPDVIEAALHGVALTGLADGLPIVLPFATHPDAGVRLDATHALYSCAGEPAAQPAIDALIRLSHDQDDDVRDWATFGLGTHIDFDDPVLRDALAERLVDQHLEVREEAAVGLARRHDERAFEPVCELLEEDEVSSLIVEAAGHLADERLLRPLLELGEWWEDDSDVLRRAIARCDPAARERFDARTRVLVELIQRDFAASFPGCTLVDVRASRSFVDLTTELELEWADDSGRRRDGLVVVEQLLARPDVQDDPAHAAASVLEQLAV